MKEDRDRDSFYVCICSVKRTIEYSIEMNKDRNIAYSTLLLFIGEEIPDAELTKKRIKEVPLLKERIQSSSFSSFHFH